MKGVDVHTFDFDFDLTFAALLMHADGTIHHTFAGRDRTGIESHTSPKAFLDVLQRTLPDHAAYAKNPKPPRKRKPLSVDQMPWMKRRPKQPDCYHCHNVNDARFGALRDAKKFKRSDAWTWPDPVQIGITVDKDRQTEITWVQKSSAAAKAGLKKGDVLLRMGARRVLTLGDIQRVLHESSDGAAIIPLTWSRSGKEASARLALGKGWKVPTPLVFSWRATKWPMSPKPGFGGRMLTQDQKRAAGLDPSTFAFKIGYLVTWGPNAYTGRNAHKAGLRKGDVIVSIAGKDDFKSMDHYHAWFRLTQKPGTTVDVERLRKGKREVVKLPVLE